MSLLPQTLGLLAAASAMWLMVRAGSATRLLRPRVEPRCVACGRRLEGGRCPCSKEASFR